jgi:sterol desaturase/sphingolipid hydroxylase (fatty acid hydroxylase superfamily)
MVINLLEAIIRAIKKGIQLPFSYVTEAEDKRIFILYLLSSVIMAYYIFKRSNLKYSFKTYLFNKKIWTCKSALIDYYFIFFNSYIKLLLIGPLLIYGYYLSYYVNDSLHVIFGKFSIQLPINTIIILYTIALTLFGDFSSFLVHYIMHKSPFLWRFHKIHHSATVLNPITQYRIHPIELLINNIRGGFVIGLVTGVFNYLSVYQIDKWTFIGVNVFHFLFLLWGANLRHSHVKFSYPTFFETIFISPFQHQIHHSSNPEHYDKNMGSKFALWDWMFGTLVKSKDITKNLKFGLGKEDKDYNSFIKNIITPFKIK